MTTARSQKSGQIVLVLVFLLVGIVFLLLAEVDIFTAARSKTRLQNAGDAAALAAAVWQGTTLNLIGELNLVRLAAACETNYEAVAGVYALQERLAVAGPCQALLAANAAARANLEPHLPDDTYHLAAYAEMDAMGRIVQNCAELALYRDTGGEVPSPSWPTKHADYAGMLRAALSEGAWAGADNAEILPVVADGGHPLYWRDFYRAADGGNASYICRRVFGGNHAKAVSTLRNWSGWGAVPEASRTYDWDNPEFFGVHLRRTWAPDVIDDAAVTRIVAFAEEAGIDTRIVNADNIRKHDAFRFSGLPWFALDPLHWREWTELDPGGAARFPLRARVKDEYYLKGAAAACRVVNVLLPVSDTTTTNLFSWTAAAHPFGSWRGMRANVFPLSGNIHPEADAPASLVMPVFRMVRLIPLGGVGGGGNGLGASNRQWIEHVWRHVPQGFRDSRCAYCRTLEAWDGHVAREVGRTLWDNDHDDYCAPPASGGGGPGGGTSYAH